MGIQTAQYKRPVKAASNGKNKSTDLQSLSSLNNPVHRKINPFNVDEASLLEKSTICTYYGEQVLKITDIGVADTKDIYV